MKETDPLSSHVNLSQQNKKIYNSCNEITWEQEKVSIVIKKTSTINDF